MRPVFYPYKMHSSSAKVLAQAFGAECVKPDGKFMNNYKRPVINWGNSETPNWMQKWDDQLILNHPMEVQWATNKYLSFKRFKAAGVKHPEWTTNVEEAVDWAREGIQLVARHTLTGKGGEGIEIINYQIHFSSGKIAPLYTKYFKKKHEYRVHVVDGKIIDFAMKKSRTALMSKCNYQIRNVDNGWVFCRGGVLLPPAVAEEAIKAVAALGLDFGAVDVGYNVAKQEACVFEVNTAPGIQGQTVDSYVMAFKELLNA